MIEKEGWEYRIECDCCEHSQLFDHEVFTDAIADAKSYGWIIKKFKNDWAHFCSKECAK